MPASTPMLLHTLRTPEAVVGLSPAKWDILLRQARRHDLLARLGCLLEDRGLATAVPAHAQILIAEAQSFWRFNATRLRFEIDCVRRALAALDVPVVLLKGGAYLAADLPAARGRRASDLDVLVPRRHLATVEQALLEAGWEATKLDDYDQHYYRTWMHELPPLRHPERRFVIDVHHAIAPPTSRARPETEALLAAASRVPGWPGLVVLAPADMVLHAAIHLFNEEIDDGALRDLVDLHMLMAHFAARPDFWADLTQRARRHGVLRPLFYLLFSCRRLCGTPVPDAVLADVQRVGAPAGPVRFVMAALLEAALTPENPDQPRLIMGLARWVLYVRAHWLRMPPLLLSRHLAIKLRRRLGGRAAAPTALTAAAE